ncbi:hypothetical protein [Spiroplasma endosymbiont of Lasioglossum malachurum]|uniref:hypothetical protein n=1 Tax=Spiroplasma endosymbiont of Lasioglossum malachurum TaxID=3066319 RepID=UPI0030CA98F0
MLDFAKYFDLQSDGEYFDSIMKNIIKENRKNENVINISEEELILKETNDFKEFKSLIEKEIKMFIFNDVKKTLQEWKLKNFKKIYALEERRIKYSRQNYPDEVFQTHYAIYQRINQYFNNDYNTLVISEILKNLKELEKIYKELNKFDDVFTDNCFLLEELLPEFQESISKNSMNEMQNRKRNIKQLAKENEQENEEWDIIEEDEIKELKSNNTNRKIALYELLNKKLDEKKKLKFKPWNNTKHKQIDQEITKIKKELQTIEEHEENENNKVIEQIITEVNQLQVQPSINTDDDMNNYYDEQTTVQKQSSTL